MPHDISHHTADQTAVTLDDRHDLDPDTRAEDLPWFATRVGSGLVMLITGLIAMGAAAILMYERVQIWKDPEYVTSCDLSPWVSCGTVMQSWQAQLFGFPNHFIGLVGFTIVITLATVLVMGMQFTRTYWICINIGVVLALVFCLWLWTQAVYDINVLCLYCMVIWAAVIPLAVLVTARNIATGVIPTSATARTYLLAMTWPMVVLLYAVIAGSILIRFGESLLS